MLVAGALASICAAQDAARSASGPSSKNPVIKVEVNQVLVPVVVTDKRGHSVTGLFFVLISKCSKTVSRSP